MGARSPDLCALWLARAFSASQATGRHLGIRSIIARCGRFLGKRDPAKHRLAVCLLWLVELPNEKCSHSFDALNPTLITFGECASRNKRD
jgi:hypothetical protein